MITQDPECYPVDDIIDQLRETLAENRCCVLKAETGAGKSTRVPLWLLGQPWLDGRKILMLEPRRLATSMVAERMADTLKESVGETVGYRIRLDTKVSTATQIEVVTEGILTRMIQSDPELTGVGLVIFDEFHERSVNADLGLALCKEIRNGLRPDLRLLVMSATIEAGPISRYLDGGQEIVSKGRHFPVDIHYLDYAVQTPVETLCADAVLTALEEHADGDVLVFLPGESEIMRCKEKLKGREALRDVEIHTLYGRMPHGDQKRAVRPSAAGSRKVILATTIAESSLTIEGVRIVVDSGLSRTSMFSPKTGMDSLVTVDVSQASADQRAGRAGRLGPGICYRLWTEPHHARLKRMAEPEILMVDLAPTVLQLALWGIQSLDTFDWFTKPLPQTWEQATVLLGQLGTIGDDGRITERGKHVAQLPVHPRLGTMILGGKTEADTSLACDISALLSDRDVFFTRDQSLADIIPRLDCLHGKPMPGISLNKGALSFCKRTADDLRKRFDCKQPKSDPERAGALLALAFPDRIAQKRLGSANRYLLSNGRGASLDRDDQLNKHPFLVAPVLDDRDREAIIRMAAPIAVEEIERLFEHLLQAVDDVVWDSKHKRVSATRRTCLDAIILRENKLKDPASELVVSAMVAGVRDMGLAALNWTDTAIQYRQRMEFLHWREPESWPATGDSYLLAQLEVWLAPFLNGVTTADQLKKVDIAQALQSLLNWEQQQRMDNLAPASLVVPSGAAIHLDYSDPKQPVLPVQVQKMFGSTVTPSICNGAVPLKIHLLSPAGRPVQVTDNLERFWTSSYGLVRKELRGRYPKHYWPEDPVNAKPTNTTRGKM